MRTRMCWLKRICSVIRTYDNQDEVFVFFDNHSSIVSRTFEKNKWKVTTPSGNDPSYSSFISSSLHIFRTRDSNQFSGCRER